MFTYPTLRLGQWIITVDHGIPWGDTVAGIAPPLTISPHPAAEAVFIYESLLVLTPGVSLGVFSLRERHNATYNEHMSNEWTAYSDATSWPMESSMWTDPHDRVQTQPTRFTSRLIWMLVPTKWGLEPQILRWQTSTIRITLQRLAISGPNLCPVTEHRG